jgi:hypothetical protein
MGLGRGKCSTLPRYIAGMTSQLEALAIAAHLDRVAYFLGMAKAESEILVRVSGVPEAERAEDESREPTLDCSTNNKTIRSIEIRAAHVTEALAPKATWSPKYRTRPASSSLSSGTRAARRSLHRRAGQFVERDGEGPST